MKNITVKGKSSTRIILKNDTLSPKVFSIIFHHQCIGKKCVNYRETGGTVWCKYYFAGKCIEPDKCQRRLEEK